jgi:hypothetical protein
MVPVIGLTLLVAPSTYFVVRKQRAAHSVDDFLRAGFTERSASPIGEVPLPAGGTFGHARAFDGHLADGRPIVVLLGSWSRGTVMVQKGAFPVYNRVAAVYLTPAPDEAWLARWHDPDLLVATRRDGAALLVWQGLPTAASLRRHLEDVARSLDGAPSSQ